ncbi:MAG: glycosyltransferase, partial [Saprospiraceae bacterium]
MKITIITPSFNSSNTIVSCFDSIKNQTYKSIEHLIVDGSSKDDTIKIAKSYPHISKIISEPDHGIYDAMNKGIKISSGDIIGI